MRNTRRQSKKTKEPQPDRTVAVADDSSIQASSEELQAVTAIRELVAEALSEDSDEGRLDSELNSNEFEPANDSDVMTTLIELNRLILDRMEQRFSDLEFSMIDVLKKGAGKIPSVDETPQLEDAEHEAALKAFHKRFQSNSEEDSPEKQANSKRTSSFNKPISECSTEELQALPGVTQADLDYIQHLKDQLESLLRETEVELSISRAKLTQQLADLEEREVDLSRREKELLRKSEQKSNSDDSSKGMLSRMKHFLGKRHSPTE